MIAGLITLESGRSPRSLRVLGLEAPSSSSFVLTAEVSDVTSRSPFGWRLRVELEAVDGEALEGAPSLLLYVPAEMVGARPCEPGDVIEVFADVERFAESDFPHGFDERAFYRGRGYVARATAAEPPQVIAERAHWRRGLTRWRIGLEDRVLDAVGEPRAGPVLALTTGTRGYLPPEYRRPFVQTGTAHLLAISGLHLGALAGLLWLAVGTCVVRLAPRLCERHGRRRLCGLVVVVVLAAYVAAIGAPVSAVRAWSAIAVAVGALVVLRAFCPLHTIAAAALGVVIVQPSVVYELGFQLSFAATSGILLFLEWSPAWLEPADGTWSESRPMRRWLRRCGIFIGVSLSASVATWPVLLWHFGVVSPAGLWVNLVATPVFSAVIFPFVAICTLVGSLLPPIASLSLGAASGVLAATRDALAIVAQWPSSEWIVGVPAPWVIAVTAVCVVVICTGRARVRRTTLATTVLGVCLVFGGPRGPDDGVRVHFIPVGQGDATLLEFPDGQTMLIDAGGRRLGPDPGRRLVVPYLQRLGVRRLDWLVITHADWDHVGAATAVVDAYPPRTLVVDAADRSAPLVALVERVERVEATESRVEAVRHGFEPADLHGVEIVRPDPVGRAERNDRSLVVLLREARATALFAGDIELVGENWLRTNRPTRSTLLKVPHHGSRTSSSPRFLDAVQPLVAVSSSGRNHYFGHPHAEVVQRYERRGVGLFGTHRDGLVVVDLGFDGRVSIRAHRRSEHGD